MPVYAFQCTGCAKEWEAFLVSYSSDNPACEDCAVEDAPKVERIWAVSKRSGYQIFPYTTSNLTGKPIEIKDAKHLKQLEKKFNVRLRDDAAYNNQEYAGYDRKTGKQVYKEGSGRGMPGQWV